MTSNFTKGDINRLGERLREDKEREGDIQLLDDFRVSFNDAFGIVIKEIRKIVDRYKGCTLNDRQTKTRQSIKHKLKRKEGRQMNLSRMQDIRGCRIVIEGGLKKIEIIKEKIKDTFKIKEKHIKYKDDDRGYRAIHIIIRQDGKDIEIQLRTDLQDSWANLCEKYASPDFDLKYGGREAQIKNTLKRISENIKELEEIEKENQSDIHNFYKNFYKIWLFKKYRNLFIKQKKILKIKNTIQRKLK